MFDQLSAARNPSSQLLTISPLQVRAAVHCYDQLKADLDLHVQDLDSLSQFHSDCVPCDYRDSLTEVLHNWDSLCRAVDERQVDMGELGRAVLSFDDSLPHLISVKDELSCRVSAISSENFNIDEVFFYSSLLRVI